MLPICSLTHKVDMLHLKSKLNSGGTCISGSRVGKKVLLFSLDPKMNIQENPTLPGFPTLLSEVILG